MIERLDPVDVAFMAIGAKRALTCSDPRDSRHQFEGEVDYIQACLDQATLLQRAWHQSGREIPGVWSYDVAETFGFAYGTHLLQRGDPTRAAKVLEEILKGVAEAYA